MDATHAASSTYSGHACVAAISGAGDSFPGGYSGREPPDTIPNSEVKPPSADGSVGLPHVRVGHCQAPNTKPPSPTRRGLFFFQIVASNFT